MTSRFYEISSVNVYNWERKFNESGIDELADTANQKEMWSFISSKESETYS